MRAAAHAGAMDAHRALNYLAVRDARVYTTTAAAHARGASLTAVDTRVDVTEEFPFLATKLAPYYDR